MGKELFIDALSHYFRHINHKCSKTHTTYRHAEFQGRTNMERDKGCSSENQPYFLFLKFRSLILTPKMNEFSKMIVYKFEDFENILQSYKMV